MTHRFAELMFTPAVKAVQERLGSRGAYERLEEPDAPARNRLGDGERAFITARDSFYMATVNERGWPYVQHRGGPPGFLKVLDDRTLGFADYKGNRQYVSVGNLMVDDRVSLFLVDYPGQRRLKMLGRVRLVDVSREPAMLERLRDGAYEARIERGMVIALEGFDWNCPQHITPRFTRAEVDAAMAPLLARLHEAEVGPDRPWAGRVADESGIGTGPLDLIVTGVRQLTPRVRAFELRDPGLADLPAVVAGVHLTLPVTLDDMSLATRTYSISSDPARRDHYEIAVLHEPEGRGGSRAVHRDYVLGQRLRAPLPRNAFPLHEDDRPAVLIAGGIGITPFRAMVSALRGAGRAYHLHYAARSLAEAPFASELRAVHGDAATLYLDATARMDVGAILDGADPDAVAYACGPLRLLDAVLAAARARRWPDDRVRFERFAAAGPTDGEPFDLVLARSGRRVRVGADETALEALERAGVEVPSNCRTGTCATCVVRVTAGAPDHRDTALSDAERAAGGFTTCVSRVQGGDLTIDL